MLAFLFAVSHINMSYGEEVTKSEKMMHSYKLLHDWPSVWEQLHLGQHYNSEHGIHLETKS